MTYYTVKTPVPLFTGSVGNVDFVKGEAKVHGDERSAELAYFRQAGYVVEEIVPAVEPEVSDDNDPITPPPGNASAEAWREHVLAIGAAHEIVADQVKDLTRDQLKELAAKITEGTQA